MSSSRNQHPQCHRARSPCCPPKKTRANRCPLPNKGNLCTRDPSVGASEGPCSSRVAGGGGGGNGGPTTVGGAGVGPTTGVGEQPLRNHLSDACIRQQLNNNNDIRGGGGALGSTAQQNVEAEVDRLVDCARAYSEKEKFKLKQYYEEEIVRKKKAVIQEFKCVMEREVIAPLKNKLCEYEKEIQALRCALEQQNNNNKGSENYQAQSTLPGNQNNKRASVVQLELDVVDSALKRAQKTNIQLQKVIGKEKSRKKVKSPAKSLRKSMRTDPTTLEAIPENVENEDMAELEYEEEVDAKAIEEDLAVMESMLQSGKVGEEVKALVGKVKALTEALMSTRDFTEEEIRDLIREGELMETYRKQANELEIENEELKRKIAELLEQLEAITPPQGSVDEENMALRRRIQELEGERTRGSLQSELNTLKQQLGDVWAKNEEQKGSEQELIPEGEDEPMDGADFKETPPSMQRAPGSKNQSPQLSKGPSAKTLSGKSSGARSPGGQRNPGGVQSRKGSAKSEGVSARSVADITGPFQNEIKLLLERIKELEDHLNAMSELELRLKELEEQALEMDKLRQQIKESTAEVEELRAKECPICPAISETELADIRKKLEETEKQLDQKIGELEGLNDKFMGIVEENQELTKSVASFKAVEQKHSELENMHAQVLEEKRRKSLEARELSLQVATLEADLLASIQEGDKLKEQLTEMDEKLKAVDEAMQSLESESADLKRNMEELKRQLKAKEEQLEDLKGGNAAFEDEARICRGKMEDAVREKEILSKELDTVRKHCDEAQSDLMRQVQEQQKKCGEASGALSKKGQCILEHEKKCMNVTNQMEKDNQDLQEKLRQLQEQLDAMVMMEKRTQTLHNEMEEFHRRAKERSKELEELKKLPETCELNDTTSSSAVLPSPLFSLSDVPTGEDAIMDTIMDTTNIYSVDPGESSQCKLLTAQLLDLEKERDGLSLELEGKLDAVRNINRQLEELQNKDKKLRDDVDKACNE